VKRERLHVLALASAPKKENHRFLNHAYLAAKSCAPKPPKTDPRLVTEIRRLRTTDLALFNRKLAD
jgi:hypothetical protein